MWGELFQSAAKHTTDDMINNGMDIPKWMTTGKTIFCQKDPVKGNALNNYWSISCLPLMWKLMTRIIANSVNEYLEMYNLLLVKRKVWKRNSRGTKYQFLMEKMVLNDCKKRHTNLEMAWIDYTKAYDMILYSWLLESLGLVQVSEDIVEFIRKSMKIWNTNLTSYGVYPGKCWHQKRHISGKQHVTIAICALYNSPDPDIKKSKIRVYLEKWRKVEPSFVYGWFKDLC